ncbi:MAG: diguanylate cyclase [Clostridia bacterium]
MLTVFLLTVLLAAGLFRMPWALADGAQNRTLRVAFPIQKGLSELTEDGRYTGYIYEYLEEIAQYTGWNYQFVQVPGDPNASLSMLLEMTQQGSIDLIGPIYYSEELGKRYNYPAHNCGTSYTVLQVLLEDAQSCVIGAQPDQAFRIAVRETVTRSKTELMDFCKMHSITPTLVYCKDDAAMIAALRNGEADMLLNASMNPLPGLKTIAKFAGKPFYLVTGKNHDKHLVSELSEAIFSIEQADPYFSTTLFEKYFGPEKGALLFNATERDYITSAPALRVGFLTDNPPIQYVDADTGAPRGIAIDLLKDIERKTGLTFQLVAARTSSELLALQRTREIDLIAEMTYDYDAAHEYNFTMTRPYMSAQYILLMNKRHVGDISTKRLALTHNAINPTGQIANPETTRRYETTAACVRAVLTGEADYTYTDSYTTQYYLSIPEYASLQMVPQADLVHRSCFGIAKPSNRTLLSVLNKVLLNMTTEEVQTIIFRNTLNQHPFSLRAFVKENLVWAVLIVTAILFLMLALMTYVLWLRGRTNRKTLLDLEKYHRVYSLMNEYFFEYDYRDRRLTLSVPSPKDSGSAQVLEFETEKLTGLDTRPQWVRDFLATVCSSENGVHEVNLSLLGGDAQWLRIAVDTVFDGATRAYVIGKIGVIDEERRALKVLTEQAQRDSLTHLFNSETCQRLIAEQMARLAPNEKAALLLIDIDYFKSVNDNYGHLRGDGVLRSFSDILRARFRQSDILGRPGGDEFVAYLEHITDATALKDKCAQLCTQAHEIRLDESRHITVSIGAVLICPGDDYRAIYAKADQALYRAKQHGRDTFAISENEGA